MTSILYINDNELNIIKKTINTYQLKSLSNNNIISIELFIKEVKIILNQLKINKGIIGEDAIVYINFPLNEMNKMFFSTIFNNLGFNNVEVRSVNLILNEPNTIYLFINKKSQFLLINNKYYELESLEQIYNYQFKNRIKILGNHSNIYDIKDNIKAKLSNSVYIYYPADKFILEKIGKIM